MSTPKILLTLLHPLTGHVNWVLIVSNLEVGLRLFFLANVLHFVNIPPVYKVYTLKVFRLTSWTHTHLKPYTPFRTLVQGHKCLSVDWIFRQDGLPTSSNGLPAHRSVPHISSPLSNMFTCLRPYQSLNVHPVIKLLRQTSTRSDTSRNIRYKFNIWHPQNQLNLLYTCPSSVIRRQTFCPNHRHATYPTFFSSDHRPSSLQS